jgi:hypothetical protein
MEHYLFDTIVVGHQYIKGPIMNGQSMDLYLVCVLLSQWDHIGVVHP